MNTRMEPSIIGTINIISINLGSYVIWFIFDKSTLIHDYWLVFNEYYLSNSNKL